MAFPRNDASELIAHCHRRCCICHKFCGVKIELDHIVPRAEGGTDDIENAIPVCFDCHAEIHSYNDQHPRGRKFRPDELREHKEQWLETCENQPDALLDSTSNSDVGPLQALVDELEFNLGVAQNNETDQLGCPFQDEQFSRAIREGAIAVLRDELKQVILEAYRLIGRENQRILALHTDNLNARAQRGNTIMRQMQEVEEMIGRAHYQLLLFLGSEEEDA